MTAFFEIVNYNLLVQFFVYSCDSVVEVIDKLPVPPCLKHSRSGDTDVGEDTTVTFHLGGQTSPASATPPSPASVSPPSATQSLVAGDVQPTAHLQQSRKRKHVSQTLDDVTDEKLVAFASHCEDEAHAVATLGDWMRKTV